MEPNRRQWQRPDFSAMKTVVDIGGATGNLLAAILGRYPGLPAFSMTSRMLSVMLQRCCRLAGWLIA